MDGKAVLVNGFERVNGEVHEVLEGISGADLNARPDGHTNSVAWLIWHLTRVQDDHIADAADDQQIWLSEGWEERFALPLPAGSTGYGHTDKDVAAVGVDSPAALLEYHDAVHERTVRFVQGLGAAALERIVDEAWQPPVSLGVRLVSVLADDLQHVGQAAFVRGMLARR